MTSASTSRRYCATYRRACVLKCAARIPTPPLPTTIDATTVWRLDLDEALQLAVRQNLGVTLERKSVRISELGVTVANGLFEPTVAASYAHGSSRTPPESSTEGMSGEILEFVNDAWRVSLGQRLATGMQLSVAFEISAPLNRH